MRVAKVAKQIEREVGSAFVRDKVELCAVLPGLLCGAACADSYDCKDSGAHEGGSSGL